uniref:Uncharacterized protein n=1 Tax=Pipistrellus kuhlii TaxID=59472 RepID=A0A7J7TKA7_PIPKU|nr:hypothetical protein mPipKuh1_009363 [Pipistrellus kuhlii]
MPAPSPPGGVAGSDTPAGSECCCPRSPSLPPGPAVPCCPGCVLSAWFGVIILVPFSSLSPCAGLPAWPLPPFLRPPGPRPSPSCRCVHSAALRVRVPPPPPPAGTGLPAPVTPPRSVATCTDFSILVLSLGLGPAQSLVQPAAGAEASRQKGRLCVTSSLRLSRVGVNIYGKQSERTFPAWGFRRNGRSGLPAPWAHRDAPPRPREAAATGCLARLRTGGQEEDEASRRPACREQLPSSPSSANGAQTRVPLVPLTPHWCGDRGPLAACWLPSSQLSPLLAGSPAGGGKEGKGVPLE